jgi:hypothetical protein
MMEDEKLQEVLAAFERQCGRDLMEMLTRALGAAQVTLDMWM